MTASDKLAFVFTGIIKSHTAMYKFTDLLTQFINGHEVEQTNERLDMQSW